MTTSNEGLSNIEKEMEDLRATAAAEDAGTPISSAENPDNGTSEHEATEPEDKTKATDSQRSDTGAETQTSQEQGKDKSKSEVPPKKDGEAAPETQNQETPYASKKRGAKERIEELARERNEAKARAEQLERENAELKKGSKPAETEQPKDQKPAVKGDPYPQYTIEELEKAAEDFSAEGNDDMAAKCRQAIVAKAKAIAAHRQEDTQAAQQRAHAEFSAGWKATLAELCKEDPELQKNDYPVTVHVKKLLDDSRWGKFFLAHPDGARAAVEVAKLRLQAARVSDLEKQVAELTKEKTRLESLTAINPAPPTTHQTGRKFEELSTDEQMAELRREAASQEG